MENRKVIGWSIGGFAALLLVWALVGIAGTASEASRMDGALKHAVDTHEPLASLQQKLAESGFSVQPNGANSLAGNGNAHWVCVYKTWLTVAVTAAPDGTVNGYHLDREGAFF